MTRNLWVFCLGLIATGCSSFSFFGPPSADRCRELIPQIREAYERQYVGLKQDVLLKDFGKPWKAHNIQREGKTYEEVWAFVRSKSLLGFADCAGMIWFYMNDGTIEAVSVW